HRPCDLVIARARAQQPAEIGFLEREQTGAELSVRGDADAVAVAAEGLADARDHPDAPGRAVGEAEDTRRLRAVVDGDQRVDPIDRREHLLRRDDAVAAPALLRIERHDRGEANLVAGPPRE